MVNNIETNDEKSPEATAEQSSAGARLLLRPRESAIAGTAIRFDGTTKGGQTAALALIAFCGALLLLSDFIFIREYIMIGSLFPALAAIAVTLILAIPFVILHRAWNIYRQVFSVPSATPPSPFGGYAGRLGSLAVVLSLFAALDLCLLWQPEVVIIYLSLSVTLAWLIEAESIGSKTARRAMVGIHLMSPVAGLIMAGRPAPLLSGVLLICLAVFLALRVRRRIVISFSTDKILSYSRMISAGAIAVCISAFLAEVIIDKVISPRSREPRLSVVYNPKSEQPVTAQVGFIDQFGYGYRHKRVYFFDRMFDMVTGINVETGAARQSKPTPAGVDRISLMPEDGFVALGGLSSPDARRLSLIFYDMHILTRVHYCSEIPPPRSLAAGPAEDLLFFAPLTNTTDRVCSVNYRDCSEDCISSEGRRARQSICSPATGRCYYTSGSIFSELSEVEIAESGKISAAATIRLGLFSGAAAVDRVRDRVYLLRPFVGAIDVFEGAGLRRIDRIRVPALVSDIAVDPVSGLIFASEASFGATYIYRADDGAYLDRLNTGPLSYGVDYNEQAEKLFLADRTRIFSISAKELAEWLGPKQ